jgi:hypothetical protein
MNSGDCGPTAPATGAKVSAARADPPATSATKREIIALVERRLKIVAATATKPITNKLAIMWLPPLKIQRAVQNVGEIEDRRNLIKTIFHQIRQKISVLFLSENATAFSKSAWQARHRSRLGARAHFVKAKE